MKRQFKQKDLWSIGKYTTGQAEYDKRNHKQPEYETTKPNELQQYLINKKSNTSPANQAWLNTPIKQNKGSLIK